jgi:hypothetical protein
MNITYYKSVTIARATRRLFMQQYGAAAYNNARTYINEVRAKVHVNNR